MSLLKRFPIPDPKRSSVFGSWRKHETLTDYEEFLLSSSTDDLPDDQQLLGGPMFYTSGTTGRPKGVRGSLSGGGLYQLR